MSYRSMHIVRQIRRENGFISMKNTGFGYLHFTLSVWESENDLKTFARSGKHLEAMRNSREIAAEIRTYTFRTEEIPDWKTAKKLLFEKGRVINFE